ncbi:MAG TPA: endonuclease III [Candidatus Gastranaerophilales bacterium]|nr:endonuclease III [Candidatus Gastranaerophilales bacterium]
MKKKVDIDKILGILDGYYPPQMMAEIYTGMPYKTLVSCILSLRNRDEITFPIAEKLFEIADTPESIAKMPYEELCRIVKSINYYKTKADNIQRISRILLEEYDGKVPDDIDELLKFRGVGRKTANIVLSVGYLKPAIAVDTHVHRVSNRLGYVKTKTPEETEFELVKKLPKKLWREINRAFVLHGKNTCKPIKPLCNLCPIIDFCNQIILLQ